VKVAIVFDDVDARPDATPDERGVLEAVDAALSALRSLGHDAAAVPAGPDVASWARTLEELSPHVVLNLCEGMGGRSEGEILAARTMEALGLPLTGSPSEVLDLARRKDRVNALLEARGLPVPPWALVSASGAPSSWTAFPAIVKPAAEDGSVGITRESVVADPGELARRLEAAAPFAPLLLQAFVGTREINVGIVDREVLPLSEIVFSGLPPGHPPMVGYEAKWVQGSPEDLGTRPLCPAPLPPEVASKARKLAVEAWSAVGGRGYGRVDLRLTDPDTLHVLEVNPNPDLAPAAGLARMAAVAGWSYGELVERILAEALLAEPSDDGAEALPDDGAEALDEAHPEEPSDDGAEALDEAHPAERAAGSALPAPAEPPNTDIMLAPLDLMHRGPVDRILRAANVFRDEEIEVALEVLDAYYAHPGLDYHAVGAFTPGGELLGYTVFGPTPCTLGTWDLYWIAVSPATQGTGVGTILLKEVEGRLTRSNARLLIIETSSRPPYDPTRAFYLKRGYREAARIHDFYEDGDHRVIYAKNLTVRPEQA
jgi:D-alanine-D-alanine ligase